MLLTVNEAQQIDEKLSSFDILALEKAIIKETNNHFRLSDSHNPITAIDRDGTIYITGNNFIQVGDTVEVSDVEYLSSIYHVTAVGEDYVKVSTKQPLRGSMGDLNGKLYIVSFPYEIQKGAGSILKYLKSASTGTEGGAIRAKSVGRVRYEYATDATGTQAHIYGAPAHLWGFLEPYRRLRWS